jgi:hypothetical protein
MYLSVLYGCENKKQLLPHTALTGWFLQQRFNILKPSGHYMNPHFNIKIILRSAHTVYLFCVDLKSYYFPTQH